MTKKKSEKKSITIAPAVLPTKPKAKKPRPKATQTPGLTAAQLRELVAKHKPPQSWYDEDHEGLY
jgi:hypothetical protein